MTDTHISVWRMSIPKASNYTTDTASSLLLKSAFIIAAWECNQYLYSSRQNRLIYLVAMSQTEVSLSPCNCAALSGVQLWGQKHWWPHHSQRPKQMAELDLMTILLWSTPPSATFMVVHLPPILLAIVWFIVLRCIGFRLARDDLLASIARKYAHSFGL